MIRIRRVKSDDWQLVKALRLAALSDAPEAFSESLEAARATPDDVWQARIRQNAEGVLSICFLAFAARQPVGIAVGLADPTDKVTVRLASMWVAPSYRGTDAAGKLLNLVVAWAKSGGAEKLLASVTVNNQRAMRFYCKAGFATVRPASVSARLSKENPILMQLNLDSASN